MSRISYAWSTVPVRDDIVQAHQIVWQKLAEPGTWWTGAERVAIAAETRAARDCTPCQERKAALSPGAVQGQHDTQTDLSSPVVELIHHVTTDPGRLSKEWYEGLLEAGLSDAQYIETLGIVIRTISIDSFCRGIGVAPHPLPEPVAGEPTRYRPETATMEVSWMPTIPGKSASGAYADIYGGASFVANVVRALSLVPDEVRQCINILLPAQYMLLADVGNPNAEPGRAINRMQIELIAGRVSALNQCFY